MCDANLKLDRISGDIFCEKTVLITGATGFVGKVLLEKLLRSCKNVAKIYVIVRAKSGKSPKQRITEIFNGPLFRRLKCESDDSIFDKVQVICGDVEENGLALTTEDRAKLTETVQIIYNCAATTKFDAPLRKAVFLNVRAVKFLLQLAKECQKLQIFAHLSTAYCHLHERILYEKAYPPPADPDQVIKTCEWLHDDIVNKITPSILGDIPNTYAFTKSLGEALIIDEMFKMPVIIIRPSVVIPIWKEPVPGWTDTLNGPTGLLIGAGKGIIRTMYCRPKSYADYVPVDIVANAILVTTFDYLTHRTRRIFNITSSNEHKISFEDIIELGRHIVANKLPLNSVLWYPGGLITKSRFLHNVAFVLFQLIPAVIIDVGLFIFGYKPLLLRIQKKILKGYDVLEYYANRQWDFNSDLAFEARKNLNDYEKSIYKVDGNGINYEEYFTNCVHAARLYILKESDESIPAAKTHMKMMWYVDFVLKTFVCGILCCFLWRLLLNFLA